MLKTDLSQIDLCSCLDAFLEPCATADAIKKRLADFADFYDSADWAILYAAFSFREMDVVAGKYTQLTAIQLQEAASGFDLLLALLQPCVAVLYKADIMISRGAIAHALGDMEHARAMFLGGYQLVVDSAPELAAKALLLLADNLLFSGAEESMGWTPVSALQKAQVLISLDSHAELFAEIKQTLGFSWLDFQSEDRSSILQNAEKSFKQAIEAYEHVPSSRDVGLTRVYLAIVLNSYENGDRAEQAEAAIYQLGLAQQEMLDHPEPEMRAMYESTLGETYRRRVIGYRFENLMLSLKHYQRALEIGEATAANETIAQTLVNLSEVATLLCEFNVGGAVEDIIACASKVLEIWPHESPAEIRVNALLNRSTGLSRLSAGDKKENFHKAISDLDDAARLIANEGSGEGSKIELAKAILLINQFQALGIDRLEEAKQLLLPLKDKYSAGAQHELWLKVRHHLSMIASEQDDWGVLIQNAEEVVANLRNLISENPYIEEKRRLINEINDVAEMGVVGSLLEQGGEAALRAHKRFHAFLDDNRDDQLSSLAGDEAELLLLSPAKMDITIAVMRTSDATWPIMLEDMGYDFWLDLLREPETGLIHILKEIELHGLNAKLETLLERVIDRISKAAEPIANALEECGVKFLSVTPRGNWSLVPFSALQTKMGAYWSEAFAPLEGVASRRHMSWAFSGVIHVLDENLETGAKEAAALASHWPNVQPVSKIDDVRYTLQSFLHSTCFHFTCHGKHDWRYQEAGGLLCPDGQILTPQWVYQNAQLGSDCMVVMAACETNLTDFEKMPNESFGLASSFLAAGAHCVIGTLWPVDDAATSVFVREFHRLLKSGLSAPDAFHMSQSALRGTKIPSRDKLLGTRFSKAGAKAKSQHFHDYSSAYYWGGFTLLVS